MSGGAVTQYTLDPVAGIKGAVILEDWTEKVAPAYSVNQQADAESDRVSTPGRQPKDQQGDTPNSPAQRQLDAEGNIVKAPPAPSEGNRAPKIGGETEIKSSPAGESGVPGHSGEKGGERTSFSIGRPDDAEGSNASPGDHDSDTPPIPRVNVAHEFKGKTLEDGTRIYDFQDPKVHGLGAVIRSDGVLSFDIRKGDEGKESGTDMFASLMQRLKEDGVEIKEIAGYWLMGGESDNFEQYMKNLETMNAQEKAAANTWTGKIARKYGYGKVDFRGIQFDENTVYERGDVQVYFKR